MPILHYPRAVSGPSSVSSDLDLRWKSGVTILRNNAEGGTDGATVTTGTSGGLSGNPFSTLSLGTGGTFVWSASAAAHGRLAYVLTQPTAANQTLVELGVAPVPGDSFCVRGYLRMPANPSQEAQGPLQLRNASNAPCRLQTTSAGAVRIMDTVGTVATTAGTLTGGTRYRYEWFGTGLNTASGTQTLNIYAGESTTPVATATGTANTTGLADRLRVGKMSTATWGPFEIDDLVFIVGEAHEVGPMVESDLDARWAVRSTVTSDVDLRWAVRSTVTSDADLRWRVSQSVSSDLDARWAVRSTVTSDSDLRWRVYSRVTSDADLRWVVNSSATQVTSDVDLRWRVAQRVNSDLDLRWPVRAITTSDADLRWAVRSIVSADHDLRWRVAQRVTSDLDLRWLSSNRVTADHDLRWAVRSVVQSDHDLRWRVAQRVTSDADLRWRVISSITQITSDLDLRWRSFARISSDADLRWAVRSLVSSDLNVPWRVSQRLSSDLDLRWALRQTATADLSLLWAVRDASELVAALLVSGHAPFAVLDSQAAGVVLDSRALAVTMDSGHAQ